MSNNSNGKYKKPKRNTVGTTNPQASKKTNKNDEKKNFPQPRCPLLAKDSEWLDGLQASPNDFSRTTDNVFCEEEEVLQLVECEDGPEMKPLTIMFPSLLEEDPQTLEDMLNKTMSTTELTRHLLGQKANFSLMKKVNRLIPYDKKWMETLSEGSNSISLEVLHGSKDSILGLPNQSYEYNESAESDSCTKESTTDISSAPRPSTSEF